MDQENTGTPNLITPESAPTTSEAAPKTTVETAPPTPTEPSSDKPKKSKGLIAVTAICAILALAGIAFGVYYLMDSNNKSTEISNLNNKIDSLKANDVTPPEIVDDDDDTTTISEKKTIDNAVAQTIADPYLKPFGTFNNLLDTDFNILDKIKVAFDNMAPSSVLRESDGIMRVPYYDVNASYQYLFGRDTSLEKQSYNPPYFSTFEYSDDGFNIGPSGIGGTGGATFSIVKEAYIDNDNLIIQVYHDDISWCVADENNGYCYDNNPMTTQATLAHGNMKEIIESFGKSIPVYTMTFATDVDHYVLKNIQKPSN